MSQLPGGEGKLGQRGSELRPLTLAFKLRAIKPLALPDPRRARYVGRGRMGGSDWVQVTPTTLLYQAIRPRTGQKGSQT